MDKIVEFCGYTLTNDEVEACKSLLKDIRAKKEQDRLILKAKMSISSEISNAINEIGLATTKRIIRELNRELRELKENE